MRGTIYSACFLLSTIFLCAPFVFAKSKGQPLPCWIVTVTSVEVGLSDIYITKDRIKINDSSRGVVLVSQAPKWEISIYRPKEKSYWSGKYADFFGPGGRTAYLVRAEMFKDLQFSFDDDATIGGAKCAVLKGERILKPIDKSDPHWLSVRNNKADTAEFVVLANMSKGRAAKGALPISPTAGQAANIIAKYYKLPTEGQVPVRFSYAKVKTPKVMVNDLKNRKIVVTKAFAGDFALPSGMKKVPTEWQVYLAGGVDNFVEEMTDSLGRD